MTLNYAGVTLDGVQKLENPNYLLVNLTIGPAARPGKLALQFQGAKKVKYEYEPACPQYRPQPHAGRDQRRLRVPAHAGPVCQRQPQERRH
ncbi:cyclomaltodextrinase N-terminal domain-containing protein [Hymenobacter humi]|uniref:Cyclomaltodextrinase N-terminal domain-containing protein n=1 Tax=Hymenobacter humi TaxID=1411620 RepID=A0ABW2U1S1_9BACT